MCILHVVVEPVHSFISLCIPYVVIADRFPLCSIPNYNTPYLSTVNVLFLLIVFDVLAIFVHFSHLHYISHCILIVGWIVSSIYILVYFMYNVRMRKYSYVMLMPRLGYSATIIFILFIQNFAVTS
jgi:NADH:ubiquinone oxidoreductase subunit D